MHGNGVEQPAQPLAIHCAPRRRGLTPCAHACSLLLRTAPLHSPTTSSSSGDEQTWDLADWVWDPYSLSAAPKPQANMNTNCCQALKRRKLPAEVLGGIPGIAPPTASFACHPSAPHNPMPMVPQCAAGPPTGTASCSSYRAPSPAPNSATANGAPANGAHGFTGPGGMAHVHAALGGPMLPHPGLVPPLPMLHAHHHMPGPHGAMQAPSPWGGYPATPSNAMLPWQQQQQQHGGNMGEMTMPTTPSFFSAASAATAVAGAPAAGMHPGQDAALLLPPSPSLLVPHVPPDPMSALAMIPIMQRQGSVAKTGNMSSPAPAVAHHHPPHHSNSQTKLNVAKTGSLTPPVIAQTKSSNSQCSAGPARSRQAAAAAAAQTRAGAARMAAAPAAAVAVDHLGGDNSDGGDSSDAEEGGDTTGEEKGRGGRGKGRVAARLGSCGRGRAMGKGIWHTACMQGDGRCPPGMGVKTSVCADTCHPCSLPPPSPLPPCPSFPTTTNPH